jgi:predicted TIM-barrel fold metal-dependent hydrolase
MLDPAWQRGLARLAERDLLFETQVFPSQFADMLAAIDTAPDVTFVLLHAGMLEDRSDDGWAQWLSGMREFARRPNIYVKLSGLGTFPRGCEVASWKPVIQRTINLFGPGRCMFGSNSPSRNSGRPTSTLRRSSTSPSRRTAIPSSSKSRPRWRPLSTGSKPSDPPRGI